MDIPRVHATENTLITIGGRWGGGRVVMRAGRYGRKKQTGETEETIERGFLPTREKSAGSKNLKRGQMQNRAEKGKSTGGTFFRSKIIATRWRGWGRAKGNA